MTRIKDEYRRIIIIFSLLQRRIILEFGDIDVSLRIINEARVDTDFSTIFNDFRFKQILERDIYRFSRITHKPVTTSR